MAASSTATAAVLGMFLMLIFIAIALFWRLLVILPGSTRHKDAPTFQGLAGPHLMVLLGSGGHTGEMLRLLKDLDLAKYSRRTWVHYPEDAISLKRAVEFDESKCNSGKCVNKEMIRARDVGQGWISTVFSSLESIKSCISIVTHPPPDVLVCNGPGTSVILCGTVFVLKYLGLNHTRIVYIESLARVHNLSLSGKLLLPISDRFLVQWPSVASKYQRAEYYNLLV